MVVLYKSVVMKILLGISLLYFNKCHAFYLNTRQSKKTSYCSSREKMPTHEFGSTRNIKSFYSDRSSSRSRNTKLFLTKKTNPTDDHNMNWDPKSAPKLGTNT